MAKNHTQFDVKKYGFHFNNDFKTDIIEGPFHITTDGRCGGMSYAALDFFHNKKSTPTDYTTLPVEGDYLNTYIYERFMRSLGSVVDEYVDRIFNPSMRAQWYHNSVYVNFPIIKDKIDKKEPINLGLLTYNADASNIGKNHQVTAIGYEKGSKADDFRIILYDNNYHDEEMVLFPMGNRFYEQNKSKYDKGNKNAEKIWSAFFVDLGYSKSNPPVTDPKIDWSGQNHNNKNYDHMDFRNDRFVRTSFINSSLKRTDFSKATATMAIFTKAIMQLSKLSYANLAGASFSDSDMRKCNLESANCTGTNFRRANLGGADTKLVRTILDKADMEGAQMQYTNLDHATIRNGKLKKVDLRNANMKSTILSSTDLVDSNLSKAKIYYSDLSYANLSRANAKDTIFRQVKGLFTIFNNADLKNSDFGHSKITHSQFYHVDGRKASFGYADLSNSTLTQSDFRNAYFYKATLKNANFMNSDLNTADLHFADLRGANFMFCDLRGADLMNILVDGKTQFHGANLRGAKMSLRYS